jgi:hypothetical protein
MLTSFWSRNFATPDGNVTWPEPKPCKRKWLKVPFDEMLRHIREDKCEQCRALVLYLERESEIDRFLRRSRN